MKIYLRKYIEGRRVDWRLEPGMLDYVPVALPTGWLVFEDPMALSLMESLYYYLGYEIDFKRLFNVPLTFDVLGLLSPRPSPTCFDYVKVERSVRLAGG